MHNEEYSEDEHKIDQPIDENTIEGDIYKTRFVDDPRNGARPLKSNQTESSSRILHKKENFRDKVDVNNLDSEDVTVLEGNVDDPVDPHGSENMTEEEHYEGIVEQHTSHRFINTEAILMKSKYVMAEIAETKEITLTGKTYTHWDMIEVWDTQKHIDEVDINDQI